MTETKNIPETLKTALTYGIVNRDEIPPPIVTNGRWSWTFPQRRTGIQHIQFSFAQPGDGNNLPTGDQYLVMHGQTVIHGQQRIEDYTHPIKIPLKVGNTDYPFGHGMLELIKQIRKSYVLNGRIHANYFPDTLNITVPDDKEEWVVFQLSPDKNILRGEVFVRDALQTTYRKLK